MLRPAEFVKFETLDFFITYLLTLILFAMQAIQKIHKKSYQHDVEIAASLLGKEKKLATEVKQILRAQGHNEKDASSILEKAQLEISETKADAQYKHKLYGGTICLLALLATVLSYDFMGLSIYFAPAYIAVIYGAYRFIRGLRSVS